MGWLNDGNATTFWKSEKDAYSEIDVVFGRTGWDRFGARWLRLFWGVPVEMVFGRTGRGRTGWEICVPVSKMQDTRTGSDFKQKKKKTPTMQIKNVRPEISPWQ